MERTIKLYNGIYVHVERNLPALTICLFLICVWLGTVSENVATSVGNGINGFVDGYGLIAPVIQRWGRYIDVLRFAVAGSRNGPRSRPVEKFARIGRRIAPVPSLNGRHSR